MTDFDSLPMHHPRESAATRNGAVGRKPCARHRWTHLVIAEGVSLNGTWGPVDDYRCPCGAVRDPVTSRRGRNSHKRGNAKERAWCLRLGLDHIGQFKGTADGMNAMFVGQCKTRQTGSFPGWMAEELDRLANLRTGKTPILGVVEAPGAGHRERRLVVVDEADWIDLHGPTA